MILWICSFHLLGQVFHCLRNILLYVEGQSLGYNKNRRWVTSVKGTNNTPATMCTHMDLSDEQLYISKRIWCDDGRHSVHTYILRVNTLICVKYMNTTTARGLPAKNDTKLMSILINWNVYCLHPTIRLKDRSLQFLLTTNTVRVFDHKQRWVRSLFSLT
jgi:hypothetical protein